MSVPVFSPRDDHAPPTTELDRIVAGALLREAEDRYSRGERLIDGQWHEKAALARVMTLRRRANWRSKIEEFVLWLCIGLLGLAFVGLTILLV